MFHARHCRVPSKVPNEPSSRIYLAARSSSAIFHARLFDSAVRFGISAGGAARLWCSTTIFFAKIYQFRVGFGNLYREAPFPAFGWCPARVVRVLDTLLGTSARRFVRFGCSQDSYLYRPIRFDCSIDYVGYPSLYSVRYSTSKSCRAWNTGRKYCTSTPALPACQVRRLRWNNCDGNVGTAGRLNSQ